jgi:hypothetical protein
LDSKIPEPARTALQKAEQFELFSLDPNPFGKRDDTSERFHGFKVLGKFEVKKAAVRRNLIAAFNASVKESDGKAFECFNPRHGLRIMHNGKPIDLLICFECKNVMSFNEDGNITWFNATGSAQPVFDETLRKAGIQLPQS